MNLPVSQLSVLAGVFLLCACSDSSDGRRDVQPRGVWQEHACEMPIPEGLSETHFTCGSFTVPADWDDSGDATVTIEVAVLMAKKSPSEPDPFVFLGGGPGAWNLEGYLYREAGSILAPIAANRDIIFIDKRGNGLSEPSLFCPEYYEKTLQAYSVVQNISADADTWLAGYQNCHSRLSDNGLDLSNFNSFQVGFDVASLMDVLGYQTYNLFGISYGSYEAQVMMRDHPEKIRSVILDSSVIPGNPYASNWAPNFARSYSQLFAECAASNACASSYPNLESVFVELVNELNETPHYSPLTRDDGSIIDIYVTGDRFVTGIQQAMYRSDLIPVIPLAVYSTAAGNMSLLDSFVSQLVDSDGYDWGLYASTLCIDQVPFSSLEDAMAKKEDLNSTLTEPVYEILSRILFDVCDIWQVNPRPDAENALVKSDIPTLILAGQYDPVSPPSNGGKVAREMSQSQYFLFNGLGHGILRSDSAKPGELSCSMKMVVQFLDDPSATVDGACASELSGPFD